MADQDLTTFPDYVPPPPPKGFGPDDVLEAYKKEGQTAVDVAQKKGQAQADYTRAEGAQMRGIQQQFEGQYQQVPEFKPTPQSKESLMALFGMLGAMGAMSGGKGYGNALIAMNGMAGMLKGYSEGRADLFNQEKAKYDEGMKAVQMHNQQITEAFNRALKMAPANLSEAKAKLQQDLATLDAQMLQAQVDRQGVVKGAEQWMQTIERFNKGQLQHEQILSAMARTRASNALADSRQGGSAQFGAVANLADVLGLPTPPKVNAAEAEKNLGRLNSLTGALSLIEDAKDPGIKFGELGKAQQNFASILQRNLSNLEGKAVSNSEMSNAISQAAQQSGLDPTNADKNAVFFKRAIFEAMAIEREARGGSILPQGMFNRLTPLFDPSKTTRQAFIGLFKDKALDTAMAVNAPPENVIGAIRKLKDKRSKFQSELGLGDQSSSAAPSASSSVPPGVSVSGW
jgi:hypothetical protein